MITIHALGDSLVTAYGQDENNFIGGWGDHLWSFFDNTQVQVKVYAQGGRSSRSFLNEGRFLDYGILSKEEWPFGMGPACHHIKPGDYVLMQFCHNDDDSKDRLTYVDRMTPLGTPDANGIYPTVVPTEQMKVPTRMPEEYVSLLEAEGHSPEKIAECLEKYEKILPTYGAKYWSYSCGATYKGYLKFYADNVRKLGAIPVIVTGAARQYFDGDTITAVSGHHGGRDAFGDFPYVRAAKQLAAEEGILLLDLFSRSRQLFELLGKNHASSLQSIKNAEGITLGEARYGRPAKWVEDYDAYWANHSFDGVDETHQNRAGSYLFAGFLADGLYDGAKELRPYILDTSGKKLKCPARITHRIPEMKALYQHTNVQLY